MDVAPLTAPVPEVRLLQSSADQVQIPQRREAGRPVKVLVQQNDGPVKLAVYLRAGQHVPVGVE